ncbi:hypothetical protein A7X85_28860 [Streptomyces sp. ST1015]|nr:hypothetical protein A7X85_28860 [Streptomyces sp. ST1015]
MTTAYTTAAATAPPAVRLQDHATPARARKHPTASAPARATPAAAQVDGPPLPASGTAARSGKGGRRAAGSEPRGVTGCPAPRAKPGPRA